MRGQLRVLLLANTLGNGREDEGIVIGVARLEPRSKSASAGAKPGGFEAPATIPLSLGCQEVRKTYEEESQFGSYRIRYGRCRCN